MIKHIIDTNVIIDILDKIYKYGKNHPAVKEDIETLLNCLNNNSCIVLSSVLNEVKNEDFEEDKAHINAYKEQSHKAFFLGDFYPKVYQKSESTATFQKNEKHPALRDKVSDVDVEIVALSCYLLQQDPSLSINIITNEIIGSNPSAHRLNLKIPKMVKDAHDMFGINKERLKTINGVTELGSLKREIDYPHQSLIL